MIDLSDEEIAAYGAANIIERKIVSLWPRDRETGEETQVCFWNGSGNRSLAVYSGILTAEESRNVIGGGAIVSVGAVEMTADLQVRNLDVVLNPLHPDVQNAYRGLDLRLARMELHRALFLKDQPRVLVKPARCRFVGFVNKAPENTPAEGGQASLPLACVSITRELSRTNNELRSDDSQQRRSAGDGFFKYVGATTDIQVIWGGNKG